VCWVLLAFDGSNPDYVFKVFPSFSDVKFDYAVSRSFQVGVEGVAVKMLHERIQSNAFEFSHARDCLVEPLHEGAFIVVFEKS